jgi:hypothetical protein
LKEETHLVLQLRYNPPSLHLVLKLRANPPPIPKLRLRFPQTLRLLRLILYARPKEQRHQRHQPHQRRHREPETQLVKNKKN